MGSKYRLIPTLAEIFRQLPGETVADPFAGSGVVAYAAKSLGKRVVAGDYLTFSYVLAKALIENNSVRLRKTTIEKVRGANSDGRKFVRETFGGIFFDDSDLAFLDRAWSTIDPLKSYERELAIAALCLAAARKQPRGVFTVTGLRYDDGRRQLRQSLEDLFLEAAADLSAAVIDNGQENLAYCGDATSASLDEADIVYLDPPYTPERDDNDYIKRYHFLEGLSKYWSGETIRYDTKVRKIHKRFTPFAYRHSAPAALEALLLRFREKSIVLSYSSNAVPKLDDLRAMFRRTKTKFEVIKLEHRYHFGTHKLAKRRLVDEYIFVAP